MELLKVLQGTGAFNELQSEEFFNALTGPDITDAQIGAYLFSTSLRNLQAPEMAGACKSLRKKALSPWKSLPERILDTCGTGGSGLNTFNTSTAVSFLTAAAGVPTCKHGNRGRTSKSGSADVLSALGVNISRSPEESEVSLKEHNWCFLFAPEYHPATGRVQAIRKELAVRTVFNFLGPLLNPMNATHQLIGVSSPQMLPVMAESLGTLGTKRALVVRGADGLDEITLTGETEIFELSRGEVKNYKVSPANFGMSPVAIERLQGSEPEESARRIKNIFAGKDDPCKNLVLLNAGAALYVADETKSIEEGISLAEKSLPATAKLLESLSA